MREFLLYRGNEILGRIEEFRSDYPIYQGAFFPSPAFSSVEALFAKATQALASGNLDEFDLVWQELRGSSLNVRSSDGKELPVSLIHFDGAQVRWRS
jgi:hypothetical protein